MIRLSILCLCLLATLPAAEGLSVGAMRMGGRYILLVPTPQRSMDPAIANRLAQEIDLDLEAVPLDEVIDHLRRLTGINFILSPVLQAEAPPITLRAQGMRAGTALRWICRLGQVHATPMAEGLYISGEAPRGEHALRLYDVSSMVVPVRDFPGPRLGLDEPGAGGFDRLFAGHDAVEDDPEERFEHLRELIEDRINAGR